MHPLADLPWPWSSFFGSSAGSLQKLMQEVDNIEFPSLLSKGFKDFWAIDFAFAAIVAVIAAILALFVFAKKRDYTTILNAAITLVGVFVVGFLAPPVLYLAMWASQRLSYVATMLPQGVESTANPWYTIYTVILDGTQPLTVFGSQAIGDMLAGLLQWMVSSVVAGLFLFAFMGFATWPIRRLGFGFTIYRFSFAGVVTALFLKPIVLFVLSIGAVVLKLTGADVGNNGGYGGILLIACILPVLLFVSVYRWAQKVQIEGPVATTSSGQGSWFKGGLPIGWASSRPYVGKIPQAGDTMESFANKANWVARKSSLAAKALAVSGVAAEAAPVLAGLSATAGTAGTIAANNVEKTRQGNTNQLPLGSTTAPDNENYTLNGATVTPVEKFELPLSNDESSRGVTSQTVKPSRAEAVKQGVSTIADGVSTAASGFEKAARWTSGAQRKVKDQIDRQIKGG